MSQKLLALYGLKFNPFTPDVPIEALYVYPRLEQFCWRMEHAFIRDGGFAMISGDPGTGKSGSLRLLEARLTHVCDTQVGVIAHTSAGLADFYRELGDIFDVPLSPHNRWNGFKSLRERWISHMESTLLRPVLFIDEAQEMPACVLNELRLLTSSQFDSRILLSVVLAGDQRLTEKLRRDELVPLGSRIRVRLNIDYADSEQLLQGLEHLLANAGNSSLMTPQLMQMLCEHSLGNYRVLYNLAGDLLAMAAQQERAQLDEKLYFECFPITKKSTNRK